MARETAPEGVGGRAGRPPPLRLHRYIASCGYTSRRRAELLIEAGRVAVNGKLVTRLGTLVRPGLDRVAVNGEEILPPRPTTIVLNKPRGIITSTHDTHERLTVMDLLPRSLRERGVLPAGRLDQDTEIVSELLAELGAIDVYVLPPNAAAQLIDAREKAFWLGKANGADDIIDVVVPRATIPAFMERVGEIASANGAWIAGCGHAGDGNVHLAVFQQDPEVRSTVMMDLFRTSMDLGGVISGEHGIGTEKKKYFMALEDPTKVALMRRIKAAFDPAGILNPGTVFDLEDPSWTAPRRSCAPSSTAASTPAS